MNHRPDRDAFQLSTLREWESGKLTSPGFRNNGKSSEKLEKLTTVPREVLFRGMGKARPKSSLFSSQKQSRFSRAWEKLKSAPNARNTYDRRPLPCPSDTSQVGPKEGRPVLIRDCANTYSWSGKGRAG